MEIQEIIKIQLLKRLVKLGVGPAYLQVDPEYIFEHSEAESNKLIKHSASVSRSLLINTDFHYFSGFSISCEA